MARIEVQALTAKRLDDVVELFQRPGPHGGTPQPDGCWCQFWHLRGKAYRDGHGAGNRARFEDEVRRGHPPGLLAYVGGKPVGWCRLGPRGSFERLKHARKLAPVDDQDAWALVCFFVHPSAKRMGVASALLESAVEHARSRGAIAVEGYPVAEGHMNIDAYTGYLPMFIAAGFEPVRAAGRRTIVRKRLG